MFSNVRVSGWGIVVHDGCVLLNMFKNGGYYNIPGGGVEAGETVKETTKREVYEETGLNVEVGDFLFFFDYEPVRNGFEFGTIPHMSAVFQCRLTGDTILGEAAIPDIDPMDPDSIGKAVWVDIENLPNIKLVPEINCILYRLLTKQIQESVYLEL